MPQWSSLSGRFPRLGTRLAALVPEQRISASTMLVVYVVLLFGIPARLIIPQLGAPGTPANLWAVLMMLWWLCTTVGGTIARQRSAVRFAVGLLAVCVLLSYAVSMTRGWYAPPDVRQATDLVYDRVPASVANVRQAMVSAADRGLISFAGWLGVMLVAMDGVRTRAELDRVIKGMIAMGVFVSAVGIIQYFTGLDIAPYYNIPGFAANAEFGAVDARAVSMLRRVQATATVPIEFGVVTAALFPFALHRAIFSNSGRWRWFPVACIGFAAALSISRSAVVVLGAAMMVIIAAWPRPWRRRALIVAPAAIIAIRLVAPGVVGTLRSLFLSAGQDDSVSGRTQDYPVVFRVISENPWFGRGLFTFVPRYYRILDNQLLMLLLELGIIGALVFLAVIVVAFYSARRAWRSGIDFEHRHLALVLSASVLAVFVSFATFDTLSFPIAAGTCFLLIGLCGAVAQIARHDEVELVSPAAGEADLQRTPLSG